MKIKRFCGNCYNPHVKNTQRYFCYSFEAMSDPTGNLQNEELKRHVEHFDSMLKGKPRLKKNIREENMVGLYHEMYLVDFILWNIWFFMTYKIFINTKLFVWWVTHKPKERK